MIQTFEPTISLNLESSSINPISFIRTGDNSIFLSNDDSSLIYNFDTGPVDNFDGILSNYYNNIIGFSILDFIMNLMLFMIFYIFEKWEEIRFFHVKIIQPHMVLLIVLLKE